MKHRAVFSAALLFCTLGCETPTGFERNNRYDPANPAYKPAVPPAITLTATKNLVTLSWRDSSAFEDGYIIEKALEDSNAFKTLALLPPNSTGYVDTSRDISINTWYRVASFKQKDGQQVFTLTTPLKLGIGGIIASSSVRTANSRILVSWVENGLFEDGFRVAVAVDPDPTFTAVAQVGPDVTSFVDTTTALAFGMVRRYRLSMVKQRPESLLVLSQTETPFSVNLWMSPGPSGVNILNEQRVRVTWNDSSAFEDAFELERGVVTTGGIAYSVIAITPANITTYDDTVMLSNGTQYSHRIRARKGSTYSSANSVLWTYSIPAPSLNLVNPVAADQITLQWSHQTNLAVKYFIEQSMDDGPFQQVAELSVPASQYNAPVDTTKRYRFRVRSASSAPSNEIGVSYSGVYALRFTASGHTGAILDVGFSPDGQYVATASQDNTAKLWNTTTGALVRTFSGFSNSVAAVAFSSTSDTLATGSYDSSATLWSVSSGTKLKAFIPLTIWSNQVSDVEFSRSGRYLASVSFDGKATVWDMSDGSVVSSFGSTGFAHPQSISFGPDGTSIISTGRGAGFGQNFVDMFDVLTGNAVGQVGQYVNCFDVQWNPAGALAVVSTQQYNTLLLVNLTTNQVEWTGFGYRGRFNGTGSQMVFDGAVIDVSSKSIVAKTEVWPIYGPAAISPDGSLIAAVTAFTSDARVFERAGRRWRLITP